VNVKKLGAYATLGAYSACTLGPVATYFKMPWKYQLPNLSLKSDTAQAVLHLVGEAAPFVLSRAKGYALMGITRITSQAYRLATQETTNWDKTKIGMEVFSTISPLLMAFSAVAPGYFIAAQVAIICMEIFENIQELKTKELTCDRIFPIVSHCLYLIALKRTGCDKVRLASMAFQGAVASYQAVKQMKKCNTLAGSIWGLIGTLRFYQSYRYYELKTQAGSQYVYKQRHAEKQRTKHPELTERGHEQSRLAGPLVEKYLQEKTGRTEWNYASSTYTRSKQTVQGMLKGLGRPDQDHFTDTRLGEKMKGETAQYCHDRHEAAIQDLSDEIGDRSQGIITVDHSSAGRYYARRVDITNEQFAKRLKYAEGYLFKRENGQTELLDRFLP
jgi:hypothetical protein